MLQGDGPLQGVWHSMSTGAQASWRRKPRVGSPCWAQSSPCV